MRPTPYNMVTLYQMKLLNLTFTSFLRSQRSKQRSNQRNSTKRTLYAEGSIFLYIIMRQIPCNMTTFYQIKLLNLTLTPFLRSQRSKQRSNQHNSYKKAVIRIRKHILVYDYQIKLLYYDYPLPDAIVKFDIDLISKVIEVKIEVI